MDTIICLILSVLILAAFGALAIYLVRHPNRRNRVLTPINVMLAGVLLASTVMFFPAYYRQQGEEQIRWLNALLLSFYSAIRMFGAEGDYSVVQETVALEGIGPGYMALMVVLTLVAPLLTFGFVLTFFKNLSASIRYLCSYWQDVYIFSGISEKSLLLAGDLKKKHPRCAVVFTNVARGEEEQNELHEKARGIGAICFQRDILTAKFGFHAPSRELWFFAMTEDEAQNVSHALGLMEQYGDRKNTHLYVLSSGAESEALLASAHKSLTERIRTGADPERKGAIKLRRINEVQSLINRMLCDSGVTLFENARPAEGGRKISAVVVGMGKHGTAMVKTLIWYCQMDGYQVQIDAFDADELAEEIFAAQCPELMPDPEKPDRREYDIRIHAGVDVRSKTFADHIHSLSDTTYVLVALGGDELNIRTALDLRMRFERNGAKPAIQLVVYDGRKTDALETLRNFRGQAYDLDVIGDLETVWTADVLVNTELEAEALRRHLKWGQEEDFWNYEYNYRSSVALAIHTRAKILLGMHGAGKPEGELTEQQRDALERMEHRRWNAYMRSEGYVFSGSTDKKTRNDLGKMHHDLVVFEELSAAEKRKDSAVSTN